MKTHDDPSTECPLTILIVRINSKSFPWTAESVQGMTCIQLVAASRRELLTLLIHSRGGATIFDIALLLSID